jgi:predicted 2-oxoglutarate/Fe(II)-dependent dioxygenase YbiX
MKYTHMIYENVVSTELCNQAVESFIEDDYKDGLVGSYGAGQTNKQKRDTDIQWAKKFDLLECVLNRFIVHANQEALWNYDITEPEIVQIARYKPNQFYGQHMDCFVKGSDVIATGNGGGIIVPMVSQRKISASLLLNDESEYEGGDLIILDETIKIKKQGTIIVFPSFMAHQVTPVTQGVRYSAVCWMGGPKWK